MTGAGTLDTATGLVIVDGIDANTAALVEDLFDGTTSTLVAATAGDEFYLLADNGTNSYLFKCASGADTAVVAAEASLILTISGVADCTTLTTANFRFCCLVTIPAP